MLGLRPENTKSLLLVHGSMLTVFKSNRAAGMTFPVTVEAVYTIAKDWISSTTRIFDAHGIVARGATFMLADEVRVLAVAFPTPSFSQKKGKSNTEARGRAPTSSSPNADAKTKLREDRWRVGTCFEYGEVDHATRNCPH